MDAEQFRRVRTCVRRKPTPERGEAVPALARTRIKEDVLMRPSRGRFAARVSALALALGLAGLWIPQQHAAAAAGDYSGSAYSDIVHVTALNIPDTLELADAAIAPSTAEMNS